MLKVISDVGIVGFPNAGKSICFKSEQCTSRNCTVIATTLSPKIGVVKLDDSKNFVVADLPGLIKGASMGKGMGNEFLSHIEKTKVLMLLIDGSRKLIKKTYKTLLTELEDYSPQLASKKRIVVINKIDTWR